LRKDDEMYEKKEVRKTETDRLKVKNKEVKEEERMLNHKKKLATS
jgi:hypothetical protein